MHLAIADMLCQKRTSAASVVKSLLMVTKRRSTLSMNSFSVVGIVNQNTTHKLEVILWNTLVIQFTGVIFA